MRIATEDLTVRLGGAEVTDEMRIPLVAYLGGTLVAGLLLVWAGARVAELLRVGQA